MNEPVESSCVFPLHTEIDWDDRKKDITKYEDRLADAYLGKTLQSDMTFLVELDGTAIPAHTLIVCAASQVLEKLIFGSGSLKNTDRVVKVSNCPKKEFMILLRSLYTGFIPDLTIGEASVLLPLVHYFDINHFEERCVKRIQDGLTPKNVCNTFDHIHFLDNSLTDMCLAIMDCHTPEILADGSLMKMQDSALSKVLTRDQIIVPCESDLFKPMLDWADKQCAEKNIDIIPTNRRDVLKDRIYLIRFAAMSSNAFVKCLSMVGNNFFTADEIASTMLSMSLKKECKISVNQKTFSMKRRLTRIEMANNGNSSSKVTETKEILSLRNMAETVSLVGFDTDVGMVANILDEWRKNELKFVQTGKRVVFHQPIRFINGRCTFYIKSNDSLNPRYANAVNNSDVFMASNAVTFITAIYK